MTLTSIQDGPIGKFLICSDSLSAVQSLGDVYTSHPILSRIHNILFSLKKDGFTISFAWVPSHVGIKGNELADTAAKEATTEARVSENRVTSTDLRNALRHQIISEWQSTWSNTINNKLRRIKTVVKDRASSYRTSRHEEVLLTRLRIGHSRLTHLHLLHNLLAPVCDTCDVVVTI